MTRINVVPPKLLSSKHLVAEYRELPRVFGLARKAWDKGTAVLPSDPATYTLGKGHVRFFYPRLKFLAIRQSQLVTEMLNRGFEPKFTSTLSYVLYCPKSLYNDWVPDQAAIDINWKRLRERDPGHYGKGSPCAKIVEAIRKAGPRIKLDRDLWELTS